MTVWAVVVAAGGGSRFGGLEAIRRLWAAGPGGWSVDAARSVADGVVLVVPPARTAPGRRPRR